MGIRQREPRGPGPCGALAVARGALILSESSTLKNLRAKVKVPVCTGVVGHSQRLAFDSHSPVPFTSGALVTSLGLHHPEAASVVTNQEARRLEQSSSSNETEPKVDQVSMSFPCATRRWSGQESHGHCRCPSLGLTVHLPPFVAQTLAPAIVDTPFPSAGEMTTPTCQGTLRDDSCDTLGTTILADTAVRQSPESPAPRTAS